MGGRSCVAVWGGGDVVVRLEQWAGGGANVVADRNVDGAGPVAFPER